MTGCQPGLLVWRAGRIPYRQALAMQERLVAERAGWTHDLLLLLEHPPVVTLGRGADQTHLRWSFQELAARGIDLVETSRGGDITYHGPGQLVGYPLIDLNHYRRDLHAYLRNLENVLIRTLGDFGLKGERHAGCTGVWIGPKKIASIGVAVRKWVTWHGFALNIGNNLDNFAAIIPCGIHGVEMTSIFAERGHPVTLHEVANSLIEHFAAVFDRTVLIIDEDAPTA